MQAHTTVGYEILAGSESELLKMAATIALTHHEWFDGSGYPRGLKQRRDTARGADRRRRRRLRRPAQRPPLPAGDDARAGDEVDRPEESGTHFDPEVVDALIENLDEALALRG